MNFSIDFLIGNFAPKYTMTPTLIYVHIGSELPDHLVTSLVQARMFSPEIPVFVAANHQAIRNRKPVYLRNSVNVQWIALESIPKSNEHVAWLAAMGEIRKEEMYWYFTRQRFLFLNDLIEFLAVKNVWHLECDNLIFSSLTSLTAKVKASYSGIAATFNNDFRCIPGCIFFPDLASIRTLSSTFIDLAGKRMSDMKIIAQCALKHGPKAIGYLPIMFEPYLSDYPLTKEMRDLVDDVHAYTQSIDEEGSIFDASAHGQFLDGTNWGKEPGYITAECIFDPSNFGYEWQRDHKQRLVPYVHYRRKSYRLNNLHIQSKRLERFASSRLELEYS